MYEHWEQNQERYLADGHSNEMTLSTYRMLWFYGQCLRNANQYDASLEMFRKALKLVDLMYDKAIEQELRMQIENTVMTKNNEFGQRKSSQQLNAVKSEETNEYNYRVWVKQLIPLKISDKNPSDKRSGLSSPAKIPRRHSHDAVTPVKGAAVSASKPSVETVDVWTSEKNTQPSTEMVRPESVIPIASKPIKKSIPIESQIPTKPIASQSSLKTVTTKTSKDATKAKPTSRSLQKSTSVACPEIAAGTTEAAKPAKRNVAPMSFRQKTATTTKQSSTSSSLVAPTRDSENQAPQILTTIPKASQPVKRSPDKVRPLSNNNDTNSRVNSSRPLISAAARHVRPRIGSESSETIPRTTRGAARRAI